MKNNSSTVCFSETEEALTAHLSGEIDHHSAAFVRQEIDNRFSAERPPVLKMDLSGVTFMDSSGLGLIMGRLSRVSDSGGELVVTNPSPSIEKILRLAGMERMIRIERNDCHEKNTCQ